MTSKLSWIAFVPFAAAAIAIRIAQLIFITDEAGTFFGLNSIQLSYVAVGCVVIILLLSALFCLIDRKTASAYKIKRNIPAGLFGILFALILACDGANRVFSVMETGALKSVAAIDAVLTIICAIVFVVMGLGHFVGNGGVKGLSVFYLIPAIWSALRLILCFLKFTTISITVLDISDLVTYVFTTMYLFNFAMLISLIDGKNPVKSTIAFGMPACAMLISYGSYKVGALFVSQSDINLFVNCESFGILVFGLYILSFIIELTLFVKKKDEVEIIKCTEDMTEKQKSENTKRNKIDSYDLIIDEDEEENEGPVQVSVEDKEPVSESVEQNDTYDNADRETDSSVVKEAVGHSTSVSEEKSSDYDSTMDRIDKLLLELSNDEAR